MELIPSHLRRTHHWGMQKKPETCYRLKFQVWPKPMLFFQGKMGPEMLTYASIHTISHISNAKANILSTCSAWRWWILVTPCTELLCRHYTLRGWAIMGGQARLALYMGVDRKCVQCLILYPWVLWKLWPAEISSFSAQRDRVKLYSVSSWLHSSGCTLNSDFLINGICNWNVKARITWMGGLDRIRNDIHKSFEFKMCVNELAFSSIYKQTELSCLLPTHLQNKGRVQDTPGPICIQWPYRSHFLEYIHTHSSD